MAFIFQLTPQVAVLCFLCVYLGTCSAGRTNLANPLLRWVGGGEQRRAQCQRHFNNVTNQSFQKNVVYLETKVSVHSSMQ